MICKPYSSQNKFYDNTLIGLLSSVFKFYKFFKTGFLFRSCKTEIKYFGIHLNELHV